MQVIKLNALCQVMLLLLCGLKQQSLHDNFILWLRLLCSVILA
jgi:hypothetical protein